MRDGSETPSGEDAAGGVSGDRERGARGGRLAAPESELAAGAFHLEASSPIRVEKPWGYELIWAHTELYVGKLLVVHAGEALSLQFHEEKDETLHLLSGELRFEVGPGVDALQEVELKAGMSVRIEPGVLHRMEAVTECRILEASTPELDDVIRVEDRYGRAGAGGG
jgi:mannose-6-phosphate isomerase